MFGDRRLIEVALDNLVGNAFKYSSRSDAPRIEIGKTQAGGVEAIYVRDNGIGFDDRYADQLFSPFQRLQTDFEGTGIGLATVQRVAQCHGGTVWAESQLGQGATFYMRLPGSKPERVVKHAAS